MYKQQLSVSRGFAVSIRFLSCTGDLGKKCSIGGSAASTVNLSCKLFPVFLSTLAQCQCVGWFGTLRNMDFLLAQHQ